MRKKRLRVWGLLLLAAGILLILYGISGVTGFVIFEASTAIRSVSFYLGLFLLAAGILLSAAQEGELEKTVKVYDSSKGKSKDVERYYVIEYANGRKTTLGELRREVESLRAEKEGPQLVGILQDELVAPLEQVIDEEPNKAEIVRSFLGVLGINEPAPTYSLTKDEKLEIRTAFKDWSGTPTKRQMEVAEKYGLEYEPDHPNYKRFVYVGTSAFVTVSSTPSAQNAGKNVAKDLIHLTERGREMTSATR